MMASMCCLSKKILQNVSERGIFVKKAGSILLCFIILLMTFVPVGASPSVDNIIELTESGIVTVGNIDAETEGDYALDYALGASTDFFNTEFIVNGEPTGAYTIGTRFVDYKLKAPVSGKYRVSVDAAHLWVERGYTIGYYVNKIKCASDEISSVTILPDKEFATTTLFDVNLTKGINELRLFVDTKGGSVSVRNFKFERVGDADRFGFIAAEFDRFNKNDPSIYLPYDGLYDDVFMSGQTNYGETIAMIGGDGRYLEYDIDVPKTGAYRISGTMGGENAEMTVTAFAGTKETKMVTTFSAARDYVENAGFIYLYEGENVLRLEHSGSNGTLSFVEVVFTYLAPGEIEKVCAKEEVLSVVPRGTDRLTVVGTNIFNDEAISKFSLKTASGSIVKTEISLDEGDNKKINIDLLETLAFGAEYVLNWSGLSDAYGYAIADDSISFTASESEGDLGSASIEKVEEECIVKERNATISAIMKGSEGKTISGRKYEISKIVKPDSSEVTSSLPNGTSGENGEFTINYTFPTEGFGSGLYKFYLSGEYVEEPCMVELLYVTEADKESILDALKITKSDIEVQTHLENADTKLALAIEPTTDLAGLDDKLAFYKHFVGSSFTEIEEFKKVYNKNIVLETINQATTAETISAVLEDSEKAGLLELDTKKYELISEKKSEFLEAFLAADRAESFDEIKALYDELANKYMLLENSIPAPVFRLDAEDVKEGQDIVLEADFIDEVQKVKQIVLYFEAESEKIDEEKVSFETDADAKVKISGENGKIKVELTFDKVDEVSAIGSLSIISEYETGDDVKFISSCDVVYDVGSGYDLIHKSSEESVSVSVKKTGSSGGGGSSSRPSAGGGSGATVNTPDVPKEPEEKTEPEIKTPFGDLETADWAKESIAKLYVKGVVSGDGENFYPNRSVTRAEFTKMLVNSLGLLKNDVKCEFGDISEDSWEYVYVASAVESGLVTGDENGNFNGNSEISREDMCVMLYRAWQIRNGGEYENSESFKDESQISSYAKDAVYAMRAFGIINGVGDNNFAPKTTATRAMAAKVIAGFMEGMNL